MIQSIIVLITIAIIFYILYKVFNSLLKTIVSLSLILLVVLALLGVFIYKDINNIKTNRNKPTIMFLEDDELIAGMTLQKDSQTLFSQDTIDNYNVQKPKERLGTNFKIITIKMEFIEDAPFTTIQDKDLNMRIQKEEIINTLKSQTPMEYFLTKATNLPGEALDLTKQDILDKVKGETEFKAALMNMVLKTIMEKKETTYIIKSYKKGRIKIYKETITFKMMKFIPSSLMAKAIEGSIQP